MLRESEIRDVSERLASPNRYCGHLLRPLLGWFPVRKLAHRTTIHKNEIQQRAVQTKLAEHLKDEFKIEGILRWPEPHITWRTEQNPLDPSRIDYLGTRHSLSAEEQVLVAEAQTLYDRLVGQPGFLVVKLDAPQIMLANTVLEGYNDVVVLMSKSIHRKHVH